MTLNQQDVAKLQETMTNIWKIRSTIMGKILAVQSKQAEITEDIQEISSLNNDLLKEIIAINNAIKD